VSSTANFERWARGGGKDAAERAAEICTTTLDGYEAPAMDDDVRARLAAYVSRRRTELGD
jgi:trimethylamine--corrinoid protein Co-methyltransferase